ncbi:MAG TPA: IS110 family transposase [Polyangiales bacterium]|nr:IS110 family transposase [Polyangiales bacterium]
MSKVRFVGLDVHKDTIAIAVADQDGSVPQVVATVPYEVRALLKQLKKLGSNGQLRCCYEAGPTGFGLCRTLCAAGIECIVVAPSLIPKQAGDRVKTDPRDAVKLARFLRSGDLTAVHVPDEHTEAMRDLERAREDAKRAERTARHQLSKFLLRHGYRYSGTSWSQRHLDWIRKQHFEIEAQRRVLENYLDTVVKATQRVVLLTRDIAEMVETWSLKPLVKALQALRGVQLVSAVTIAAELGEMSRFSSAPQLMAYVGLIPSEHSSGGTKKRGGITRTGNQHVRKTLVESAWSYRHKPAMSYEIRRRNNGVSTGVRDIAWKAQQRLHRRYRRLLGRGKSKQQTVTALARELAGFIWAIGRQPVLEAA